MAPTLSDSPRARLLGALVGVLWVVGLPVAGVGLGLAAVTWVPSLAGSSHAPAVRPASGGADIDAGPVEGFAAGSSASRAALAPVGDAHRPRLSGRAPAAHLAVHLQSRACAGCAWSEAGVQHADAAGRFDFGTRAAAGHTTWWRVWTQAPGGGRTYSPAVTTGR